MKYVKKIKRDTLIIIASVFVLTLLTMNFTYSYVFSVKSASKVETFKAGTLDVVVSGSTKMTTDSLMPALDSAFPTSADSPFKEDSNSSYATLVLNNSSSTLPAQFSISIEDDTLPEGKTEGDRVDKQYIKIGVYDAASTKWVLFSDNPVIQLSSLEKGTIVNDSVKANESRTYYVFVWLSDTTPVTQIGKYVYLKLDVNSLVKGQKQGEAQGGE